MHIEGQPVCVTVLPFCLVKQQLYDYLGQSGLSVFFALRQHYMN